MAKGHRVKMNKVHMGLPVKIKGGNIFTPDRKMPKTKKK